MESCEGKVLLDSTQHGRRRREAQRARASHVTLHLQRAEREIVRDLGEQLRAVFRVFQSLPSHDSIDDEHHRLGLLYQRGMRR